MTVYKNNLHEFGPLKMESRDRSWFSLSMFIV